MEEDKQHMNRGEYHELREKWRTNEDSVTLLYCPKECDDSFADNNLTY